MANCHKLLHSITHCGKISITYRITHCDRIHGTHIRLQSLAASLVYTTVSTAINDSLNKLSKAWFGWVRWRQCCKESQLASELQVSPVEGAVRCRPVDQVIAKWTPPVHETSGWPEGTVKVADVFPACIAWGRRLPHYMNKKYSWERSIFFNEEDYWYLSSRSNIPHDWIFNNFDICNYSGSTRVFLLLW